MNENHILELEDQKSELGTVEISPEVIEVIAGIAASEVDGVATMRGNFAAGVAEKLGRKNHGKGVKVELDEEGITVDVSVVISYGVQVPKVAKLIQHNIKQALQTMTAIDLQAVNVHVVGVQFETTEVIDTEALS
ncbi:firmicute alkaline shock protein-like protein [Alkalihalophilus pseudofirmus OF4]|uniref:Firmicute alkaline shock protein-like protein n=1 Tax=Alkalihalophilus pseudofirmus (strain ATCC BAA-2126 / JCM 17055 / OF4) TaxID=398511 RepID=D3FUU9_ALKPO|nr:Asp23/Gls24 family envelope stress response protein [Alkalihalophilus pseudofirmus]ADC48375.1 firmicute alkaline shock protein-like protein [Alkalihalophilus pseudofirmus OF4]